MGVQQLSHILTRSVKILKNSQFKIHQKLHLTLFILNGITMDL